MTRKQKNMLTTMLKGFNTELRKGQYDTYTYKADRFKYNGYAVEIEFDIFFSKHMNELIKFKVLQRLSMFLGARKEKTAFIHII
jgi:hypothetical protein